MANAIRYSTTGDTQSLKKGNFYFGVGDVGKGPSSATTYYNGSTPSASGYTVYSFDASQPSRISYASPTSDSEFISITNVKSGQNFTGVTQCLNWYATQTDHVSVNKDYEPIVSDGLVLNVDAGYTPSYSRSGTTWYDLSYNGYNPTLINGTTYNNSNGGVMVFDGVNDYVGFSSGYTQLNFTGSTPYTLEMFVKVDEITEGSYERLVDKEGTDMGSGRDGYNILTTKVGITSGSTRIQGERWVSGLNYGGFSLDKIDNTLISVWNHFVWSYSGGTNNSKFYNNGYLVDQRSAGGLITNILRPLGVMGPSGYNKGSVSSFKVYNRPLSSSEILQNYQAQFPRFLGKNIVMNGLIHYLDAGYNGSYPTSGTSWYNISGVSGGTGTLTNGPVYSGDGGGSIVFDGVDDYVSTLNSTNINSIYSNNQFTLQIWIKYDDSGQYRNIAGVLKNSDFTFFAIGMRVGIFNNLFFDGVFNGSRVTQTIINDISPFRNAWVNVTASYRNGSLKTYFNGVLVLTTSTTGQLDNFTSNSFKIAEQAGYGYFKGNISNFNLYNKQLTDIEILQNYQAQLPTIVGENFITNGLVLYLDAKYKTSYPGTGTTWNNVSGVSGGTNTLVNGPVYSGTSGGTITFDGTDDYADFNAPNLGTTVTVEMWCKIGSGYSNKMFFGWDRYDVWCNGGNIGFNTAASDLYGISSSSVSSLGLVNNWKHYVFEMRSDVPYTNNKIYINGTSQTLSQQIGTENASVRNFNNGNGRIAFWRNGSGAGTFNMPMECAVFKVYNRSLTQNEINQNFNATKSRFGI